MKNFKKIFIATGLIVVIAMIAGYLFLQWKGRGLLEEGLSSALNQTVKIDRVSFQFPAQVKIRQISFNGNYPAEESEIDISLVKLYKNELHFSRVFLFKPSLMIKRAENGDLQFINIKQSESPKEVLYIPGGEHGEIKNTSEEKRIQIIIDQLVIKNGNVDFSGNPNENMDGVINLKDLKFSNVDFTVKQLNYPIIAERVYYDLSADISNKSDQLVKSVESNGWVNIIKKNMKGFVQLARPDGGQILEADILSENNDMKVEGVVDIKNIWKIEKINSEISNLGEFLADNLTSKGVAVDLNFSFQTKMDDFKIKNVAFSGNLVTDRD